MRANLMQSLTRQPPFCHREAVRASIEAMLNAREGRVPYPYGLPDFMDSPSPHYFHQFSNMLAKHIQQFDSRIARVLCEKISTPSSLGSTSYRLTVKLHSDETFDLYIQTNWLGKFDVRI